MNQSNKSRRADFRAISRGSPGQKKKNKKELKVVVNEIKCNLNEKCHIFLYFNMRPTYFL